MREHEDGETKGVAKATDGDGERDAVERQGAVELSEEARVLLREEGLENGVVRGGEVQTGDAAQIL